MLEPNHDTSSNLPPYNMYCAECTRLLLAAGANVNALDCEENSVLHYASSTEHFSYLQVALRFATQQSHIAN